MMDMNDVKFWEQLEGVMERVIDTKLQPLESELKKISIVVENEVKPALKLLADGYLQNDQKLDRIEKRLHIVDGLVLDVGTLMTEARLRNEPKA